MHDSHQGKDPRPVTNDGTLTSPTPGQGVQAECPLQGVIVAAGQCGPGSPARARARVPPNSKSNLINSLRQLVYRSAASPGLHQGLTYRYVLPLSGYAGPGLTQGGPGCGQAGWTSPATFRV